MLIKGFYYSFYDVSSKILTRMQMRNEYARLFLAYNKWLLAISIYLCFRSGSGWNFSGQRSLSYARASRFFVEQRHSVDSRVVIIRLIFMDVFSCFIVFPDRILKFSGIDKPDLGSTGPLTLQTDVYPFLRVVPTTLALDYLTFPF